MATDVEQEGVVNVADQTLLSPMEIDAIGEVMNISMGSAATAVSTMLDKQVVITTPKVNVEKLGNIDNGELEPAIIVKITYTEGIDGSNVMVFRQQDMQLILNQLMGVDEPPSADFVFDELSMSAACEVMNQMMGAAATALSEFLGKPINISTPTASIMDSDHTFIEAVGLDTDEDVVSILFNMNIKDVMSTEFVSVLSCRLAKMIVGQFAGDTSEPVMEQPFVAEPAPAAAAAQPAQQPAPAASAQAAPPQQQAAPAQPAAPQPMAQQPTAPPPMQQQAPMPGMQMPGVPPEMAQQGMQMPYFPYGQQPMYPYGYPPPYPQQPYPQYPPQQPAAGAGKPDPVNVHSVQFPEFGRQHADGDPLFGGNMDLIMNVPLNVEIVIGKTKRKIKDIMNFSQGTVVELEKQAGAPVDIMVNGQLIAHGDVVVIDDNFGVRITEIVGTKELLSSLEQQMQ